MSLVTVLAPELSRRIHNRIHEEWGWVATPDERVLWAILAGVALLAAWGAWLGWRRGPRESRPD